MKQLFVLTLFLIGLLCLVQGQIYNEGVHNNTGPHYNEVNLSSIVENSNTKELISATSVTQPNSSLYDILIQVYYDNGKVKSSIAVGDPSRSEKVAGIALCDDMRSVIVVGEYVTQGGSQAFAMRVELSTGFRYWYNTYDAASFAFNHNDRFCGIKRDRTSSSELYVFYGTSGGVYGNNNKLIAGRIDINGNINTFTLIRDNGFLTASDGIYFPSDIEINAKGHYILTGTYKNTLALASVREVFLLTIETPNGSPQNRVYTYRMNDAFGLLDVVDAPHLVANNPLGEYVLAMSTSQVSNSLKKYITSLSIDQSTLAVNWTKRYNEPNYSVSRATGIGMLPGLSRYFIGTTHATIPQVNPGPTQDYVLGMLTINTAGVSQNLVEYGFISNDPFTYNCMEIGKLGIYHKAIVSGVRHRMIRSDFNGGGSAYACFANHPRFDQGVTTTRGRVRMFFTNEPGSMQRGSAQSTTTGNVYPCTGGSPSPFRQVAETIEPEQKAKLLPSFISQYAFTKIEFESEVAASYSIEIFDLKGQRLYHTSYRLESGTHSIKLPASLFSSGINLVRLSDEKGQVLLSSRVIKE